MKYFPQKTSGKPYCQKSGRMSENWKGGLGTVVTNNESGLRHPKTIQKYDQKFKTYRYIGEKNKSSETKKQCNMLEKANKAQNQLH